MKWRKTVTQNRQEHKKQFKGKINNQNIPSDTSFGVLGSEVLHIMKFSR